MHSSVIKLMLKVPSVVPFNPIIIRIQGLDQLFYLCSQPGLPACSLFGKDDLTKISFHVIWKISWSHVDCLKESCLKDIVSKRESGSVQFVQGEGHLYAGSLRG